jgi:hypothetical protein
LSVWPSTRKHPVDFIGDLAGKLDDRLRQLRHLLRSSRVELTATRGEQNLRLEHETVANHPHIFAARQDLAQAAEEIGAVAVELLHPLRQRDIQPTAEIGNLRLGLAILGFGHFQRILKCPELGPEGRNLLVEQVDLVERPLRDLLLRVERFRQRPDPGFCRGTCPDPLASSSCNRERSDSDSESDA